MATSLHIGALAELGEEYVALQGVWQDIDPSRFQRGLMNIFLFLSGEQEAVVETTTMKHQENMIKIYQINMNKFQKKMNLLERNQVQNKL